MRIELDHPYYADELGIDDPDSVIRGIYVGACVETRNTRIIFEKDWGHAHNQSSDIWSGWACIALPEHVLVHGEMSNILAHEVAHLLCPDQGHTPKWKRVVTKMGHGNEIRRCGLRPL